MATARRDSAIVNVQDAEMLIHLWLTKQQLPSWVRVAQYDGHLFFHGDLIVVWTPNGLVTAQGKEKIVCDEDGELAVWPMQNFFAAHTLNYQGDSR